MTEFNTFEKDLESLSQYSTKTPRKIKEPLKTHDSSLQKQLDEIQKTVHSMEQKMDIINKLLLQNMHRLKNAAENK